LITNTQEQSAAAAAAAISSSTRTAALEVDELALEVVDRAGVQEARQAAAREVVLQHLGVVLQDLPVDQLTHL
jgi:hypothetical protein